MSAAERTSVERTSQSLPLLSAATAIPVQDETATKTDGAARPAITAVANQQSCCYGLKCRVLFIAVAFAGIIGVILLAGWSINQPSGVNPSSPTNSTGGL